MEIIKIYTPSGVEIPILSYSDNRVIIEAKCTRIHQGEESVTIQIESAKPFDIPLYSYIEYQGVRYRMNRMPSLKKEWHDVLEYNVVFESVRYELGRVLYDTSIDPTQAALDKVYSGGSFGNLWHFAHILVSNVKRALGVTWIIEGANQHDGGQLLSFERSENCLSALHKIAQTFHVIFFTSEDVATGVRTLKFVSEYEYNPLPSSVWKIGDKLFSVESKLVNTDNIVTRLWCFGSEEGADNAGDRITLPTKDTTNSYIEDPDMVRLYGLSEGVFIDDEAKPSYTGRVDKTTDDYLTFHTSAWNMFSHLQDGEVARIHFETGNLQGMEFSVKRAKNGTITINPIVDKELKLEYPSKDGSSPYRVTPGDTFKCLGVVYPLELILDARDKLLASATLRYSEVAAPQMEYSLVLRDGLDTSVQVGDVITLEDDSIGRTNLIVQQKTDDLITGGCSVVVSNFRRKRRVEEVFSRWRDRIKEILADRETIDKYYTITSSEVLKSLNTSDFRQNIKDELKADAGFLEATKGVDGKSVRIEDLGISWRDNQLILGGVVSPNLKGDKGEDAVPIRPNEYKAFGDIKLYPNDSFGCELIELGKGRIRLNITYKGTGQGGRTKASYYTHPTFANDERKTSICSFRVAKSSKPMTVGPWTSIEQNKREDGLFYYISRSGRRFCGFELMWNGQDAEIGDYAILEDFKIELIQDGEPLLPSTYVPHKDEMHGVQLSELVSNTEFMQHTARKVSEVGRFVSETALNSALADKVNTVELANYATTEKLAQELSKKQNAGDYVVSSYFSSELSKTNTAVSSVETRAIRPVEAVVVGASTSNPFSSILGDPNGNPRVCSINVVEGTDIYLPPAQDCAVGTKIYLRGSAMTCPVNPYHHNTTIRPIRIFSSTRDVYSAGRYYTNNTLLETFTNAEWRVDLECIVAGCGLKGWLWTNSVESKNLLELSSSITTAIQSIAETRQDLSNLKNNVIKKGEGIISGFYNLRNSSTGAYTVKATDYHILARTTANGDTYPYIRVDNSLPVGHQFIVDMPFSECRVRFIIPSGATTWGNGGTEWTHGYRYHVTKSWSNEWGIIKTAYAQ